MPPSATLPCTDAAANPASRGTRPRTYPTRHAHQGRSRDAPKDAAPPAKSRPKRRPRRLSPAWAWGETAPRSSTRTTALHKSWSHASRYRMRCGKVSTHWRTGTSGSTWSTRCAARSVIRRLPQLPPQRTQSGRRGTPARTEASALARERHQTLGVAGRAPEPGKPSREPGAPATRTLRGGVGVTRRSGTPETPSPQIVARPRRHADVRLRRGRSAGGRAQFDAARTIPDRAVCNRPTVGHGPRFGRSRAGTRRPSARDRTETHTVAVAVSPYSDDGAGRSSRK